MRTFLGIPLTVGAVLVLTGSGMAQAPSSDPMEIARILAAKYPAQPVMSDIPAMAWWNSLRLSEMTGEARWREKVEKDLAPFIADRALARAEPRRLTSLAGASSVLSRSEDGKYATVVGKLLTTYATRLQRPDGIFIHAVDAPHAWGRGNGFALLGLTEALTYLPQSWSDRARVLEIYRKHVAALAKLQSDDGSWRQVVDEPASYRELTVTAMTTAALARGVRLG